MQIQSIQFNTKLKTSFKGTNDVKQPYLNAEGAIATNNNVKPLPGEGHLVHDTVTIVPKYFIKDIGYDFKSLKNGINGTANDHQLGRLNDVGLRLGGIAIAVYLASRTSNPKTRLMEYLGLGTFLAVMDLYPKLFINLPAKLVHGYDIDKQYIDDQGRKKSVFQDSNYIPYDLYRGEAKGEDFAEIGDRMGIPRDIHNRNDIIKEQMRKIATQNNTLWMMTAGLATPIMTALVCSGLENVAGSAIEQTKNKHTDKILKKMIESLNKASVDVEQIQPNELSKEIELALAKYNGKTIPQSELDALIGTLTDGLDSSVAHSVKSDILKVLNAKKDIVIIDNSSVSQIITNMKKASSMRVAERIIPTSSEIEEIIKNTIENIDLSKETELTEENISKLTKALSENIDVKINVFSESAPERREALVNIKNQLLRDVLPKKQALVVDETASQKIVNFAKVLQEFKNNEAVLDKCRMFKFEAESDSIIARSYQKFAKVLMNELGFTQKELQRMRNSSEYTNKILDQKISELVKDEEKYEKVVNKISNVMLEMETKLHGKDESKSAIADLLHGIEKNYNLFAERLEKIDGFSDTIKILVGDSKETLIDMNSLTLRKDVENLLDGLSQKSVKNGTIKKRVINRVINERYSGAKNSLNRILHALDVYKRVEEDALSFPNNPYKSFTREKIDEIIKMSKSTVLSANSSDFTMKFDIASADLYGDIMRSLYKTEKNATDRFGKEEIIKQKDVIFDKGVVSKGTENAMEGKTRLLERFKYYIQRVKTVIGNNDTDFTRPNHILNKDAGKLYSETSRTQSAMFNLLGQSPVDFVKSAADRKYTSQKWLRTMGIIAASVVGITTLAQFTFGKISNPHTLKRVNDVKEGNDEIK